MSVGLLGGEAFVTLRGVSLRAGRAGRLGPAADLAKYTLACMLSQYA
jgi:hypothetical protein